MAFDRASAVHPRPGVGASGAQRPEDCPDSSDQHRFTSLEVASLTVFENAIATTFR